MSVFGNFGAAEVVDAAEKAFAKMDDTNLSAAVVQSAAVMSPQGRTALVESIFDAFRQRGESSEDAAEGAGTTLGGIERGESGAIGSLLRYAQRSPGLLKEALTMLVERHPALTGELAPPLVEGIARRLRDR